MPLDQPNEDLVSQATSFCTECGAVMAAGVKFCAECGRRASEPTVESSIGPDRDPRRRRPAVLVSALIVLVLAAITGAYILQRATTTTTTVEDEHCFDDESCASAEFEDGNYETDPGQAAYEACMSRSDTSSAQCSLLLERNATDQGGTDQGGTLSSAIVNVSCFPYEGANVKVYGADGEVVGAGTLGPAIEGASGCRYRYDIDVRHSDFYTVVVKDQEMFTLSAEELRSRGLLR